MIRRSALEFYGGPLDGQIREITLDFGSEFEDHDDPNAIRKVELEGHVYHYALLPSGKIGMRWAHGPANP